MIAAEPVARALQGSSRRDHGARLDRRDQHTPAIASRAGTSPAALRLTDHSPAAAPRWTRRRPAAGRRAIAQEITATAQRGPGSGAVPMHRRCLERSLLAVAFRPKGEARCWPCMVFKLDELTLAGRCAARATKALPGRLRQVTTEPHLAANVVGVHQNPVTVVHDHVIAEDPLARRPLGERTKISEVLACQRNVETRRSRPYGGPQIVSNRRDSTIGKQLLYLGGRRSFDEHNHTTGKRDIDPREQR